MIFDTSYLYFRAFFGVPATFRAPDGRPVNAVRGTLDFISRLMQQYSPDEIACAWDINWRPDWRVELIPSYKAHRVVEVAGAEIEQVDDDLTIQVPLIRAALEATGIPIIGAEDHEADDVLATLARRHQGTTLVVTGDRDLFQLVDPQTSVVYVARGVAKHELVTPEVLAQKYGLSADRYVDFAVLRGDPSDGLPGVKGIGDKSAASLVNAYPSLEAMVEAAVEPGSGMSPSMRSKLLADVEYLVKAREVVTCVDTLELPALQRGALNAERAAELSEELALGGSMERLLKVLSPQG
ncbi:5'-3' exonuclease [Tessaracoccus sp. MC1865]|nr:5'-3' exonuclease [Tessaracoccus sp. MC1865]MBB1484664.1 5'-3' exonuclease [Tessaracoccus sp. MC1865]QTO38907.1 5'-3' exonuclease [Tessaracoccus sp. MC1865]